MSRFAAEAAIWNTFELSSPVRRLYNVPVGLILQHVSTIGQEVQKWVGSILTTYLSDGYLTSLPTSLLGVARDGDRLITLYLYTDRYEMMVSKKPVPKVLALPPVVPTVADRHVSAEIIQKLVTSGAAQMLGPAYWKLKGDGTVFDMSEKGWMIIQGLAIDPEKTLAWMTSSLFSTYSGTGSAYRPDHSLVP